MINSRYEIQKIIGEGRSKVFLCNDQKLNSNIALKVLSKNAIKLEKDEFRKEYFLVSKFNHPNILKVFDFGYIHALDNTEKDRFGIEPGDLFLTVEFFEGSTLNSQIELFNYNQTIDLIKEMVSVLMYLHKSNYIYFDLKPENILVSKNSLGIEVKLIDFGLTKHLIGIKEYKIVGSSRYIAPEILNREARDFKVDLYSLGVILYRIIYGKYPIDSDDPIDIYKAQLAGEINYVNTNAPKSLVNITKKLLQRNSYDRYNTALAILAELQSDNDIKYQSFDNVPTQFIGQQETLNVINKYLQQKEDIKPIAIKGGDRSGKTCFLEEISKQNEEAVFINVKNNSSPEFVVHELLYKLIYSKNIFPQLPDEFKLEIPKLLISEDGLTIEEYKSIFSVVSKNAKTILLIDDYSDIDAIGFEVLSEILPILITNGIKVIISYNSGGNSIISNSKWQICQLTPFTLEEAELFVEINFAYFLPLERLKSFIKEYSDLMPGNILRVISELYITEILIFSPSKGICIDINDKKQISLSNRINNVFDASFNKLNNTSREIVLSTSLIRTVFTKDLIMKLTDFSEQEINDSIPFLIAENILRYDGYSNHYDFASVPMKNFISQQIGNKHDLHLKIANKLCEISEEFWRGEIAYQFEMGGDYSKSLIYYKQELNKAKKTFTYKYGLEIINHLITLPLEKSQIKNLKVELSEYQFMLGNYNQCFSIIDNLLQTELSESEKQLLKFRQGNNLINLGKYVEGIKIFESLIAQNSLSIPRDKVMVSLGDAYLYTNRFDETLDICHKIVESNDSGSEMKGKAYNLIALTHLYQSNNFDLAIKNLTSAHTEFEKIGLLSKISESKINLGNLFIMKEDDRKAQEYWDEAMNLNLKLGNLSQEGKLLMNLGVLSYDRCELESAIDKYSKADFIFSNIGDINSKSLALVNLGESHFISCEYGKSKEKLIEAIDLLNEIQNYTELAEARFLIAKLFFLIGDLSSLEKQQNFIEDSLKSKKIPELFKLKHSIITAMHSHLLGKYQETINILVDTVKVLEQTNSREDNSLFTFSFFLLADSYWKLENYKSIVLALNNKKIQSLSKTSTLIKLEIMYWNVKILMNEGPLKSSDLINELTDEVNSSIITELSWKAIFLVGTYYEARGNKVKADKFFSIAKSLIEKNIKSFYIPADSEYYSHTTDISQALNHIFSFLN